MGSCIGFPSPFQCARQSHHRPAPPAAHISRPRKTGKIRASVCAPYSGPQPGRRRGFFPAHAIPGSSRLLISGPQRKRAPRQIPFIRHPTALAGCFRHPPCFLRGRSLRIAPERARRARTSPGKRGPAAPPAFVQKAYSPARLRVQLCQKRQTLQNPKKHLALFR